MFHLEKNKPGPTQLCVAPVDSPDNIHSLNAFLNLVGSCSGPNGGLHLIRNACGGHVTMTSDCGRLLASISLSRQILKLLVSSVQSHLSIFGDGGKFLTFACLSLVISTVKQTREFTNRRVFCVLNEHFVKIVSQYLNSEESAVCVNADLTDLQVLLAYTRSILSTRPWLNLAKKDCCEITKLIVKCFVESIPWQESDSSSRHSDRIFIVGSKIKHARDTKLLKGLLLKCSELSCVKGEMPLNLTTVCGEKSQESASVKSLDRQIKVILVTCSMSGDLEDIVSATFEVTSSQATSAETLILDKWMQFCKKLALYQVGLLLCQKVIHPRLKILLKSCNIMAIDRLGSAAIPYIKDLTGAEPVVSVIVETNLDSMAGLVCEAKHLILNKKSYLHLEQSSSSVVSLILCSKTEESLEELKCCVKTAIKGLYSLLQEGKLLCGAGCWQIHCSYKLDEEVRKCLPQLAKKVYCSEAQVLTALSIFRSSVFHHWVQQLHKGHESLQACWDMLNVDIGSKHCWRLPNRPRSDQKDFLCCCGLKSSDTIPTSQGGFQEMHPLPRLTPSQNTDVRTNPFSCKKTGKEFEPCGQSFLVPDFMKDASESSQPSHACFDTSVSIDTTLDHFSAATQSLYKAVFTANLILSLGQAISDTN